MLDRQPDADLQLRQSGGGRDGDGARDERDIGVELRGLREYRDGERQQQQRDTGIGDDDGAVPELGTDEDRGCGDGRGRGGDWLHAGGEQYWCGNGHVSYAERLAAGGNRRQLEYQPGV